MAIRYMHGYYLAKHFINQMRSHLQLSFYAKEFKDKISFYLVINNRPG